MAYNKKTDSQIKTNILLNLITNVDEINDLNVGSVLDRLVDTISQEIGELYSDLDVVYMGTRINTATSSDLDNLGQIVGVVRNEGETAHGTVTLSRPNVATNNFTITQGTILSTQPNTGEPVYNFTVNQDTVFENLISDEEQLFINGVYEYKFTQRLVDNIISLSGTGGPFIANTNYSLEEYSGVIINLENYVLIDGCEAVTDWTNDGQSGAIATSSDSYQGSNSLALTKTGTADTSFGYQKTLSSSVDLTLTSKQFLSFLINSTDLAKLSSLKIFLASNNNLNISFEVDIDLENLSGDDWERVVINLNDSSKTTINGAPDLENINLIRIEGETFNDSDTITSTNFLMDFWFGADSENYEGFIIQWDKDLTLPTNNTVFTYNYQPLSVDVNVTANSVGEERNVGAGKIVYKVTNIPQINTVYNYNSLTGGINVEVDDDYRVRILSASDLANKATADAIKANVEALGFVKSCSVDDLPFNDEVEEANVYADATGKYLLKQKVPIDNATLVVEGTLSGSPGHTFVKDVDYVLNDEGYIEFGIGGDDPDDETITYTTYDYNKLGHFDTLVAGVLGNLTTTQLQQIDDVIEATKSVGITHTLNQPTYIEIDVELTPTINTINYDEVNVKQNIEEAIRDYLRTLTIGVDVLVSKIVDVVMDVEGVTNVPVGSLEIDGVATTDYVMGSGNIGIPGTITVN
jgi:uncharacterized phage protein gp47/JayE